MTKVIIPASSVSMGRGGGRGGGRGRGASVPPVIHWLPFSLRPWLDSPLNNDGGAGREGEQHQVETETPRLHVVLPGLLLTSN